MLTKRLNRVILSAAAVLLVAAGLPSVNAGTINVPAGQPTIQAGINAAVAGDTILVAPGTYNEAVVIGTRNGLVLRGSGCTVTRIQAPGQGPAIRIDSSSDITVTGFRLSSDVGGGDDSNNGAIRIFESTRIRIFKNLITQHASNGIVLYGSDIEVFNNLIVQVGDDGIRLESGSSPLGNSALIYNNTIADNRGGSGVGIWMRRSIDSATAFNNIIFNNDFNIGVQANGTVLNHDFNVIRTPATNFFGFASRNVSEPDCDPMFVSPATLDYHIPSGSCAENTGTASFLGNPAAADDYENDARPSGAGFEMGADEIVGECDPGPLSQGFWHRQCLGAGLISPGRNGNGRGPQEPTEPKFEIDLVPAANDLLAAKVFEFLACEDGMDADPPSDPCERATKQYTAMLFNGVSDRLQASCEIDLSAEGCSSTTIGDLVDELAALINSQDGDNCRQAASCAAAVNEGDALTEAAMLRSSLFFGGGAGDRAVSRPQQTSSPGLAADGDVTPLAQTGETGTLKALVEPGQTPAALGGSPGPAVEAGQTPAPAAGRQDRTAASGGTTVAPTGGPDRIVESAEPPVLVGIPDVGTAGATEPEPAGDAPVQVATDDPLRVIERHLAILANTRAPESARSVARDTLLTVLSGGYEPERRLEIARELIGRIDVAYDGLLAGHLEGIRSEAEELGKEDLAREAARLLERLEPSER